MDDRQVQDGLVWLAYALGDMEAARSQPGRGVRPRIVANLAQQAAEKALKAALVLDGTDPPRVHDLDDLRNRLAPRWRLKRRFPDLARLSRYASESRYPDDIEPVTPIQSATAVRQAAAIVRSIREDFDRSGIPTARIEPR
ncbi:MAG: HEPN domain-containing protein [Chloroflexota bacterium]